MCKNQKISLHFPRASSPHPSAAKRKKKWKGIFWFCFAVSVSEKSTIILTLLVALFSALTATEAHPYPRFVVILVSAHTSQPPRIGRSHSLTMPARCLLRIRSVASFEPVVTLKSGLCLAQANLYVLAPPTLCAHRKPLASASGSLNLCSTLGLLNDDVAHQESLLRTSNILFLAPDTDSRAISAPMRRGSSLRR